MDFLYVQAVKWNNQMVSPYDVEICYNNLLKFIVPLERKYLSMLSHYCKSWNCFIILLYGGLCLF